MKHCHISIMCNELIFLKRKLPFLYQHFSQLIFVDYNCVKKCNSEDGSIEFVENFVDKDNKITLIKNFNPLKIKKRFHGRGSVEKQKMFAVASKYINEDIDVVWATDLDEFFEIELINEVENLYQNDKNLISIDLPHKLFAYNQFNVYNTNLFYIVPSITKHKKKIYGHCDFDKYGKTVKYPKRYLYHLGNVGYKRCYFKFVSFYKNKDMTYWLNLYLKALNNNEKYVTLTHQNKEYDNLHTIPYNGNYPDYLDIDILCDELNKL